MEQVLHTTAALPFVVQNNSEVEHYNHYKPLPAVYVPNYQTHVLGKANNPQTELNFLRIESGLYQCAENGKLISKEQAEALEGSYLVMIEIISDLKQAPTGYQLIPFPQDQILNSLLISKQ